jgi:hypothetical protein
MRSKTKLMRRGAILCVLATAAACSGSGSSPTQPPPIGVQPSPSPSLSPSPTPTPTSTPPVTGASCSIGKGDIDARCGRTGARLLPDVEAAIDRVVRAHPQYFNLQEELSPGAYRVLDVRSYLDAVVSELSSAGFCAGLLGDQLQVKNSQDFSEEYDVITSSGFVRRGAGSYVKFCSPAAFPLTVEDVLHRVHVLPVGLECPDSRAILPTLDKREIPVGCTMIVTATPKDKNLNDVDPRLHGPDIKWDMPNGDFRIKVEDFHEQPFNLKLIGREAGEFAICAEVARVAGCMIGTVTP